MLRTIEAAKLTTPARNEMFAGMYFAAAERMADRVSRKEGRQIWRNASIAVSSQKHNITRASDTFISSAGPAFVGTAAES